MNNVNVIKEIEVLERDIYQKKKRLMELKKSIPESKVKNFEFVDSEERRVTLSGLFGEKNELMVIHNMGRSCRYCTMWADGFNGVYHYLNGKASFVVSSPDTPKAQADFAASRKWQFPMISVRNTAFAEEMGFKEEGRYLPGVSTFRKDAEGNIYLHRQSNFGQGDDYCVTWHLFDLLPSGSEGVDINERMNDRSPFQLTNNIAIGIKKYEQGVDFYRKVLGMKLEGSYINETKFSSNGTNFYIENHEENNVYFEFEVEDIKQSKQQLLKNGCIILKENSKKSLMVADPFGMKFHLYESET
ncbi:DUF899 family protein [Bacillus sp. SG-1]|uniref:DUF899 family protein n=1 Tax=Bacillus sp. SG-1 TaxID=161544 RepID=UPI000154502B|nr:DUF899 family protein [Bacillus sp. SG-1]EDL64200.1 hypothetical protein BSG1_19889 [Bacillus sp. SG-1]